MEYNRKSTTNHCIPIASLYDIITGYKSSCCQLQAQSAGEESGAHKNSKKVRKERIINPLVCPWNQPLPSLTMGAEYLVSLLLLVTLHTSSTLPAMPPQGDGDSSTLPAMPPQGDGDSSTLPAMPPQGDGDSYTAGVVEFAPNITLDQPHVLTPQEALQRMMYNLRRFERYVKEGREGGADIIVFPEDGIYGFLFLTRDQLFPFLEEIPDPQIKSYTPCGDVSFSDRPVLSYLSCLARNYQMVVVANMGDKQKCHNSSTRFPTHTTSHSHRTENECPPNGWYQYNTNVVFDSDGSLLAKYHKAHLYGAESEIFDTPHPTPHVVFNTSFGVTFGTFTCYDILYCDPPLELLNMGVRNFVFPTAWGNSYPFYTSIAFQQAWSWRASSNFLAANLHFPNKHSFPVDLRFYLTGSGIYSQGHALRTFISGENFPPASGKLLIATLEKQPSISIASHAYPSSAHDSTTAEFREKISDVDDINTIATLSKPSTQQYHHYRKQDEGGSKDGWDEQVPRLAESDVSDIDMNSNTYLNFTALDDKLSNTATASYTDTETQLYIECTLDYARQQYVETEAYALGAYIGGSVDNPELLFAVCSLVKCASSEPSTCGAPVKGYTAQTVFDGIKLSGSFPDGSVVMPEVQLSGLELASPSDVTLAANGLMMGGVSKPLLSANLWSRIQPGGVKHGNKYHCSNTHY